MKRSAEIEAVVRRFLDKRMSYDAEAMQDLHSKSEHLRLIGSDKDEWHLAQEAVRTTGGLDFDEE